MKVTFNMNEQATVTLNEEGLKILSDKWMASCDRHPSLDREYFVNRIKEIRENGFLYTAQLWSIIDDFGQYIGLGMNLPFHTTMSVETSEDQE